MEHLSELDNIINSLESVLKSVRTQTEALEQEIQAKTKDLSLQLGDCELKKLLSGFQYYFDNPSYKERTGIYKYGASKTASGDLKKVMDLTRKKYQDDIIYLSIHLNATNDSNKLTYPNVCIL